MSGDAHTYSAYGLPSGRVLGVATALTLTFAAVEAGVGWWARDAATLAFAASAL